MIWRSSFEAILPGRPPAEVRNLVKTRGGGWMKKGLHVRVRGDQVKARINQMSQIPDPVPTLIGELIADPAGTKVNGELRWTNQVLTTLTEGIAATIFLIWGVSSASNGDRLISVLLLLGAAMFGGLAFVHVRFADDSRRVFERELTDALQETFR